MHCQANTLEPNESEGGADRSIANTESVINIFKTQIIVKKETSGSMKIRTTKIFNNNRKTIYLKEIDNQSATMLLKNHFNPNGLNVIIIGDEFLHILTETFINMFSNNLKFKIIRWKKMVEDIEEEDKLAELIEQEH
ncbi:unnamed protein product [Hermetia illucens]|uniref:Uncharacterized protein n=1 Tax=Hermetia illucens TaxID=343691 RepID=A0A7R8UCT6_HERIL|nr:unnamed protein product [Hermetia illucens]